LLALLAISTCRASALAASLREQTRAIHRERRLRESVQILAGAARRSSTAVFAALDERLRECDPRFDSMLAFVVAGDELACAYASGSRSEHYRRMRLRRDDVRALPARAAASRCRVQSESDGMLLASDRYALAVSLCDPGVRAVVYVSSPTRVASPDVDALVEMCESAAVPYASAVERESDRTDATHDGLTGLLSPRAFRRQLHEELARVAAGAPEAIVSLWFVDTDRFKSINDRYGHPAGDAVLQTMASLLKAHLVPGTDVAARNGGDEFCALIRNASKAAAVERARRFLEAVGRHEFAVPAIVTASVGVATYPHDATSSNDLLELADGAMYHSKRNGRNRVSFVDSPGRFASLAAEAETQPSRSHERWPSPRAVSSVESFS
jgi:diguanylate cyclase (GGDEF)-like protein